MKPVSLITTQSTASRTDAESSPSKLKHKNSEVIMRSRLITRRQVMRLLELKQQLEVIRQRKEVIPDVPDPDIVDDFNEIKEAKLKEVKKGKLQKRVEEKKKELTKLKTQLTRYEKEFEEKSEVFKEKCSLQKVLSGKMQGELTKTKQRFRETEFNKVIMQSMKRLLYYRVTELLFNDPVRGLYSVIPILMENNKSRIEKLDEDTVGNCLGYMVLFVSLVARISGSRAWNSFSFKGHRSLMRAQDGTYILLHPREPRLSEGLKQLAQQMHQWMLEKMDLKVEAGCNFYQLVEVLSRSIMSR